MRKLLYLTCLFTTLLLFSNRVVGQMTLFYSYSENLFIEGKEAFLAGKYDLSAEKLSNYLKLVEATPAHKDEADFLLLVGDLYSKKEDADKALENYAKDSNPLLYTNQAYLYLGDYSISNEQYADGQKYLNKCKEKKLPKSLQSEYNFKYGLALLNQNKSKDAYVRFEKVKNSPNKYTVDATYYCGYIHYLDENYEEAKNYFKQVNSQKYRQSIEYYNLQMEFLEGNLEDTEKKASALYKNSKAQYKAEIARILGFIKYENNDLSGAINYYEVYQENVDKLSRDDIYILGESYFSLENYDKAADAFTKVATLEDELSQTAYNKLASCYLKLDDKQMARMAFESSSRYSFNKEIQEEALFNYCKLTYELSYSPFNEIIEAFEKFLKQFPNSNYNNEVYSLLSDVFLNTNNYERAYQSLKKININNPKLAHAMQRVAYFRAIELFNDLKYEASLEYFIESLKNSNNDKKLKAQTSYWLGEAYYRLNEYQEALNNFNDFVLSPFAPKLEEFKIAHYSLGYTYFKMNQPNPSIIWFGKYATLQKSQPDIRLADSYNRLGDNYYMKRDFDNAIKYYDYSIEMGLNSSDYSYFQKAFCLGLQRRYTEKISVLNQLTRLFKESTLLDDAWCEKGKTYRLLNQPDKALAAYEELIKQFPESLLQPEALLHMALINYNNGQEKEAVAIYRKIIEEFPRTDEANASLTALKTISIDNNSIDEYISFTKQLGNRAKLSGNEADSLTYISAEKIYMKGNIENSKKYFANYIEKYPDGKYVLNAHYYKADCHLRSNEVDGAMNDLEAIVNAQPNVYTEEALAKLASIQFQKKDYNLARTYFSRLKDTGKSTSNILDAMIGILRCSYFLNDCERVLVAAQNILNEDKTSDEYKREAYFYQGKCQLKSTLGDEALVSFSKISSDTRSEFGAEAKYRVAELYYYKQQPEKAVEEIKDFIDKNTPHQYWLGKAFIILAKISVDKGNDFQAKQYLTSVKENYKGKDEIQEEIARMLFEIDEREAKRYQQRRDSLMQLLNDTTNQ